MFLKAILLHQQPLQGEVAELVDVFEDELSCVGIMLEELVEKGAADRVVLWHRPQKLNHLRQVIISLTVVLTFARVEKEIASDQLKGHTSQ